MLLIRKNRWAETCTLLFRTSWSNGYISCLGGKSEAINVRNKSISLKNESYVNVGGLE